jgi:hypothetical protein
MVTRAGRPGLARGIAKAEFDRAGNFPHHRADNHGIPAGNG